MPDNSKHTTLDGLSKIFAPAHMADHHNRTLSSEVLKVESISAIDGAAIDDDYGQPQYTPAPK